MSVQPYQQGTPEYSALEKLHRLLEDFNGEYENTWWWKKSGINYLSPMWTEATSKTFINRTLDETEAIPCKWLQNLMFWDTIDISWNKYERLIRFVKAHEELINEVRERGLHLRILMNDEDLQLYDERLKEKILSLNEEDRTKAMKNNELRRALYPYLLVNPRTMTWQEIYEQHERDVLGSESIFDANVDNWNSASPWKSRAKVQRYAETRGWTPFQVDSNVARDGADRFDMKKQRKLMTHQVAQRHTLTMDYFFAGRFLYCLAININTRKAFFALPKEIQRSGGHYKVPKKFKPTIASAIQSLKDLLSQTRIEFLVMDNEPAWRSKTFQRFLKDNGIGYEFVIKNTITDELETHDRSRLNHSTTGPIDRLIRTLRMMNYHLGNSNEIPPNVMKMLVDEYNNSPHTTLSKFLKRSTTPNEVHNDYRLERKIMSELSRENFIVRSRPEYAVKGFVRVLNAADKFDKVKPRLLPGHWKVVGTRNGLVELEQNKNRITVNRWMLKS